MTKQELFDAFEGKISKSAIRKVDDEYRVVGKFCYVAPQDGGFAIPRSRIRPILPLSVFLALCVARTANFLRRLTRTRLTAYNAFQFLLLGLICGEVNRAAGL